MDATKLAEIKQRLNFSDRAVKLQVTIYYKYLHFHSVLVVRSYWAAGR